MNTQLSHMEKSKSNGDNGKTSLKDNFYLGINEKWLNDPQNAIPPEYPRWGGFIQLHDEGLKNQIGLAKELSQSLENGDENISTSQRKIAAVWAASNSRFQSWDNKSANYSPILKELVHLDEVMPVYSIENVATYMHYSEVNGFGNVLDFNKGEDFANTENTVLDLSACGKTLPSRDYYLDEKFSDKRAMYLDHLNNVKLLINDAGWNLEDSFANDVLSFETDIAKISMSPDQSRKFTEYYTDTTLSALCDKRINELNYLVEKEEHYDENDKNYLLSDAEIQNTSAFFEMLYNKFEFRRILLENRSTHYTYERKIKPDAPGVEQMYVYDGDAIRRTLRLILNNDNDNFRRYKAFLQYKLISANKAFTTKELDDEFFDFHSRKMNGTQEQQSRDKRSINVINAYCGELMGQVYVEKFFPISHKDMIVELISGVRQSMGEAINENDWLKLDTKKKAIEKLDLFGVKVGYPDVWKDYSDLNIENGDTMYDVSKKMKVWAIKHEFFDKLNSPRDHEEWGMTPQTVNAYFHSLHNEIVFPAAILQKPFFTTNVDEIDFDYSEERSFLAKIDPNVSMYATNCGSIVAVIAHEITHGYDDNGKQFDGKGTKVNWWTNEDTVMFKEKTHLMINQASKYSFDIVSDKDGESVKNTYTLNGELTMGENLADLGGLSLGLRTLNTELERRGIVAPDEIRTYHRIFFKSFANIWRTNTKDAFRIKQISFDPHAPPDFRGNLVSNIGAFYDAFDVKEGDGMYLKPEERLNMW
jgi:predicted metalloendopeptidase